MLLTPIKSLGYVSRTNQSVVFVLWFERCSNFNQVMGGIQVTYSKRVTHAVKMVDSCTRENGVLSAVARSWLLFLHDESE